MMPTIVAEQAPILPAHASQTETGLAHQRAHVGHHFAFAHPLPCGGRNWRDETLSALSYLPT